MGQNTSTVREYTPDTKPPQNENSHSLEKPKNENEDNVQKERESEMAMQKKLGVNVIKKDSDMPMKMESFIIDAIIVEKLKNSGNSNDIATAIAKKLNGQYGDRWCVITTKSCSVRAVGRSEDLGVQASFGGNNLYPLVEIGLTDLPESWGAMAPSESLGTTGLCVPESGYALSPINGTYIFLAYEKSDFTVFRGFDQNIFMNKLSPNVLKNENEENNLKEKESLKAIQKKLGINVLKNTMKIKMESFTIDTIIVEKLKHSGCFNEIASAIKVKLEDQYGSSWNVLIAKTGDWPESGYCVTTILGSYITLEYDLCKYTVFKSM